MNVIRNRLGFALRETGQALERLGCVWQGINSHAEESRFPGTGRSLTVMIFRRNRLTWSKCAQLLGYSPP